MVAYASFRIRTASARSPTFCASIETTWPILMLVRPVQHRCWTRIGLSVTVTSVPTGQEPPYDVEMRAGQMSFHHPLLLHGSNPNRLAEPRIGLSATFSTLESQKGGLPTAIVRRKSCHGTVVSNRFPSAGKAT